MTSEQIEALAPALVNFLRSFKACFFRSEVLSHFQCYCRGLLSDLPRKSVEPIALAGGATVRSLQEFLSHLAWDQDRMRDLMQQRIAQHHGCIPGAAVTTAPEHPSTSPDDLGVIGLIDECGIPKKGTKTPGVQQQYCGASGKLDNCIVNVHLGYLNTANGFQSILASDLFLPEGWAKDRRRCREADIPDGLDYRPKTRIALAQVEHALGNGLRFDFQTFDEGYGKDPAFLFRLQSLGQCYVGEVPCIFLCWALRPKYHSLRREFAPREVRHLVRSSKAFGQQRWHPMTIAHQTTGPDVWHIKAAQVYLRDPATQRPTDRTYWLIAGWNKATDEYKYWVSNAPPRTPLSRLLRVAFSRHHVEHLFRVGKSEVGMDHYEGRSYLGLMRHLVLCQLVILFLAEQTTGLRGEKSQGPARSNHGADRGGSQRPLQDVA